MASASADTQERFSLVTGGPFHSLLRRLGLTGPDQLPTWRAALLLALAAWLLPVPLLVAQSLLDAGYGGWDYFTAVGRGLFCELGQGKLDFPALIRWLGGRDDQSYVLVEQDVLPGMGTPKESARRNREYLRSLGI